MTSKSIRLCAVLLLIVITGGVMFIASANNVNSVEKNTVQASMNSHSEMTVMSDVHQHPIREVSDSSPVPSLNHLMFPDAMDGYNVQLLVGNFKFTPADINLEAVDNEGHAHLYVNGKKVSRIYSQWFHLPSRLLEPGMNMVSVTLNANDHSEWAVNGAPIASTVRVLNR